MKEKETKERKRSRALRKGRRVNINIKAVELFKGSLVLHLDDSRDSCIELGWKDIHSLRDFLDYASIMNTSALKDEIQDSQKMLKMNHLLLSEAERINSKGVSYPWHKIKDVPRRYEVWKGERP